MIHKRVAILISGGGSNMVALAKSMTGDHPARPVLVFSNVPDAGGLAKAHALGIPTAVTDHRPFGKDRAGFEAELQAHLDAAQPDIICHAGFMRILGPNFLSRFPSRVVNTHPALLPAFPGAHAVRDALSYGVKVTGVTVHLVDEGVDTGPVVAQAAVPVNEDDDDARLRRRIQDVERPLFVDAVRRLALGGWAVQGRTVTFR